MAYTLSRADLDTITDVELAFSTDKLLPPWEEVPMEFRRGNLYTAVVSAIFEGRTLPDAEIEFLPGFADEGAVQALNRCVRAHLASYGPKHQHKIAGVAFMMSMVCRIRLTAVEQNAAGADQGEAVAGSTAAN